MVLVPTTAKASIFNVIPMNEFEEPTDLFDTSNALLAYVTSDIFGGAICVVSAQTENPGDGSLSCEGGGTWGTTNSIGPAFAGITLLEPPSSLVVGEWKLLGDGGRDFPGEDTLSIPFTVEDCVGTCSTRLADEIVQEWKARSEPVAAGSKYFCLAAEIYHLGKQLNYARKITTSFHVSGEVPVGTTLKFTLGELDIPTSSLSFYMSVLKYVSCRAELMMEDIVHDPADPNYTTIVQPEFSPPPVSGASTPDTLALTLERVRSLSRAMLTSYERYLGAADDSADVFVQMQTAAMSDYGFQVAHEMLMASDEARILGDELAVNPDDPNPIVTQEELDTILALRQRVADSGFLPEERQELVDSGMPAEEIDDFESDFTNDISGAPIGVSIQSVLNDMADAYEVGASAFELMARHADVISANIGEPNQPPVALDDAIQTTEGIAGSTNVLDNDSDPDPGDVLSVSEFTQGANGSVSCDSGGLCTYTPDPGFSGDDSFTYTVSDGHNGTDEGAVAVTVEPAPANQPPVALDDAIQTTEGIAGSTNVLDNDSDPDPGDVLSVSEFTQGANGSVSCDSGGLCTYTPDPGFSGDDSFTYTVSDGHNGTDEGAVAVTVEPAPPVPPHAEFVALPGRGLVPLVVAFDASGSSDSDGTIESYEWDFGDGATDVGRTVSHTFSEPGSYTVLLTVTDDDGQVSTHTQGIQGSNPALLQLAICGDQGDGGSLVFQCGEYEYTRDVQLYRVPGAGPIDVSFDWVYRAAAINNELSAAVLDDAAGAIDGLLPGEDGYREAFLGRAQTVFPSGSDASTPDTTLELQGGDVLAFFISNGPLTPSQPIFASLDGLNEDHVDHMVGYRRISDGSVQFGFEDLQGGGDLDFDDVVFNVTTPLVPLAPIVVTKEADEGTSTAGAENGYTIAVSNSSAGSATLESITDQLPEGFEYVAGSSSGVTDLDPTSNGAELSWEGPFDVPAGGTITLRFDVTVSSEAGVYLNEASASAGDLEVTPSGPTAPVEVVGNRPPEAADDAMSMVMDWAGSVDVLANDSDPDGDSPTVTGFSDGAHGSVVCTMAGICTYTPEPGFGGHDSFTYDISDGQDGTDSGTVRVSVHATDEPGGLLVAGTDNEEFSGQDQDHIARIDVSGPNVLGSTLVDTEVDVNGLESTGHGTLFAGDPETSAQNVIGLDGSLIESTTGPFPAACCNEDIAFDGTHLWRSHWSDTLFEYLPDGSLVNSYAQSDVVGATFVADTLWITKWSAAQVGTFDPTTNTFTSMFTTSTVAGGLAYDSANNILWVGRGGGFVEAWDLDSMTLIQGSTIKPFGDILNTIDGLALILDTEISGEPIADDDILVTDEDTEGSVDVVSNDSDPDGDPLTVDSFTQGEHGSVSCDSGTGECTFAPDLNFHGTDSFTYAISDGRAGFDTATVNVTVNPVNDPPDATDDTIVTDEDTAGFVDVFDNDTDPDGDALVFDALTEGPQHGAVVCQSSGHCTYLPVPNFHGTDTFSYRVSDGNEGTDVATVRITVNSVADPEICDDGIDNDEDGLVDGDDPDCAEPGTIELDIKPGPGDRVSLSKTKVVEVAILSDAGFDATGVDFRSVCFGDAQEPSERDCTPLGRRGRKVDVDGDGDLDLVLRFETSQTGIDIGDAQACLTGTKGEEPFSACGSITVVP